MAGHSSRIPLEQLRAFFVEAFEQAGLPAATARTCADVLVTTDGWGRECHGPIKP